MTNICYRFSGFGLPAASSSGSLKTALSASTTQPSSGFSVGASKTTAPAPGTAPLASGTGLTLGAGAPSAAGTTQIPTTKPPAFSFGPSSGAATQPGAIKMVALCGAPVPVPVSQIPTTKPPAFSFGVPAGATTATQPAATSGLTLGASAPSLGSTSQFSTTKPGFSFVVPSTSVAPIQLGSAGSSGGLTLGTQSGASVSKPAVSGFQIGATPSLPATTTVSTQAGGYY